MGGGGVPAENLSRPIATSNWINVRRDLKIQLTVAVLASLGVPQQW